MSEQQQSDAGCLGMVVMGVIIALLFIGTSQKFDRQENWIRDLQRRVAELEQNK